MDGCLGLTGCGCLSFSCLSNCGCLGLSGLNLTNCGCCGVVGGGRGVLWDVVSEVLGQVAEQALVEDYFEGKLSTRFFST